MIAPAPKVIAHRGHSAAAPENSLSALSRAIEAGADYVECDVRIAGDGVLVVSHDADLERLAGRPVAVDATPANELACIAEAAGASVLRFSAFLAAARGRTALMLDVKSEETTIIRRIARDIAESGFDSTQLAIGLRSATLIEYARAMLPGGRILALHGAVSGLDSFLLHGVDLVRQWERDANPDTIAALKQRDCTVWVTTGGPGTGREVGDSDSAGLIALLAAGADGLIVNDPDLGRSAVEAITD